MGMEVWEGGIKPLEESYTKGLEKMVNVALSTGEFDPDPLPWWAEGLYKAAVTPEKEAKAIRGLNYPRLPFRLGVNMGLRGVDELGLIDSIKNKDRIGALFGQGYNAYPDYVQRQTSSLPLPKGEGPRNSHYTNRDHFPKGIWDPKSDYNEPLSYLNKEPTSTYQNGKWVPSFVPIF